MYYTNPFAEGKYNYEFDVGKYNYEFDVGRDGFQTTFFLQDPIFGSRRAYTVRTEDLRLGPSLQESIVQRLTHELDYKRRVLVQKLLLAEEFSLLDEQAVYAVDTILSVLGSKNERFARWPTPLDPDKAENFKDLREHLDEPSYTAWKMKLLLMGKRVVYTEMEWKIAKDCLEALASVERQLPF